MQFTPALSKCVVLWLGRGRHAVVDGAGPKVAMRTHAVPAASLQAGCLAHALTPLGCRYLLTHLHPLLGGAVGMKGSTVVEARLIPHDGLLPTSQVHDCVGPVDRTARRCLLSDGLAGCLAGPVPSCCLPLHVPCTARPARRPPCGWSLWLSRLPSRLS